MEYTKAYEGQFKEPFSCSAGMPGIPCTWPCRAQAVGPDPAKVRDFIEKTQGFVGMHGIFNFTPQDQLRSQQGRPGNGGGEEW